MRSLLPLALLILAACSSDPAPPADSGPLDTGPADTGADVLITHDWLFIDAGEDRPALVDAGAIDAVADVPAIDAADAGADVVAVADAGALEDVADVQLVDVAADRPDVVAVDVPRDAGPVDGGPVVYDLEAVRAGLEVRALMRWTLPPPKSTTGDCSDVTAMSCSVAAGVLNFSVRACFGGNFTGRFVLGDAGPSTLSIFGGGGGSSATTLRLATGARAGGRRSFHVQFSAAPFQGEQGFGGIPGRTVDSALADLWLLGCASD